jgi:poly(3-hydroxyalkanoate) synthetase
VREAFHAVRPQAIAALRLRIARRNDEEYREFYAAFARWAWTQRRLPGALLFDLVDLYRHNALKLGPIPQPMLLAIAERDHLVPSGASHVLTTVPGVKTTVVNVASGHVSMVVGTAAKATMWPALVDFLTQQQQAASRGRPSSSRRPR